MTLFANQYAGPPGPNTSYQLDSADTLASSNDLAHMGGKKTISPQDVLSALKDAELDAFLPRLEAELKSMSLPFTL
jgi:hypothetical protein